MIRIQIAGRTYTEQDIREGRHHDDPNIDTDAEAPNVTNVVTGENSIQASVIRGDITFG